MITKLTLENFLAHGRTVFELAPGLNVLTGPNNTGKSAVVEALRCLAANPAPRHFIRHGAAEARVEAEFDDGTRLAWVRKPKYALYELTRPGAEEPETFAKFGRTPPEEVLSALKLNQVILETGEEIDAHLGNQREPIFLLNRPGSAVAAFFAASSESAYLIAMQGLLKERARKAKLEEKRLHKRRESLLAGLDALAPLPDIELALERGREKLQVLQALDRFIPALQAYLERRLRLTAARRLRQGALAALEGASPPPALWPAAALADLLARRAALTARRDRAAARLTALTPLAAPAPLAEAARLDQLVRAIVTARTRITAAREKALACADLASPPSPLPLGELAGHIRAARALKHKAAACEKRLKALRPLAAPPAVPAASAPAALAGLAALVRDMRALAARAEEKRRAAAALDQALLAAGKRIAARLSALGACPLCGGRLDAETFLRGAHDHAATSGEG